MDEVAKNRTTIIFCNTRGLAELTFQELWKVNDLSLPIAIHHGSLDREARQRAEAAMADHVETAAERIKAVSHSPGSAAPAE